MDVPGSTPPASDRSVNRSMASRRFMVPAACAYLSKPRMYGRFGGRSPFSNIAPRVVRYVMFMTGVSMRRPTAE
jgi:hypothetical protein